MTRDELLAQFTTRRARKIQLTWAQFTGAIAAAPQNVRDQILLSANTSNGALLTRTIGGVVVEKKRALARAEVDAVAADDTLTINELIAILS